MSIHFMITVALAGTLVAVGVGDANAGKSEVAPVNNVVFEVGTRGSGRAEALWCGAANYARRELKTGWRTDIFVVRGRGRGEATNAGTAAQFTLDPSAAGVTPIPDGQNGDLLAVGYFMSVQRANSYCAVKPDLGF